jgi:hypothetical protein
MLLFWRIRYFDTSDKKFKDRDLYLLTDELDAETRAAIEACYELGQAGNHRRMLKYRSLFVEGKYSAEDVNALMEVCEQFGTVLIHDYHEDETAKPLISSEVAEFLTGNAGAVMLPAGAKQHDIDFMFAEKPNVDISKVTLNSADLLVLGYFTRDLRELITATFFTEGPGRLTTYGSSNLSGSGPAILSTAVTDEEIRSFVTIFRRLYMENEPANFQKAAEIYSRALSGHPASKWIAGGAAALWAQLDKPPEFTPFVRGAKPSFTLTRLFDIFLYTQYAHQPDERRRRQFHECLSEVGNDRSVLTHLFFSELWAFCLEMHNVGQQIAHFFDVYCAHHKVGSSVISSLTEAHPGIGTLETKQEREDRILKEKAAELAAAIWQQAGSPAGGYQQYIAKALAQLKATLAGS